MKLKFLIVASLGLTLVCFNPGWAQCPEDTCDRGICDTFYVEVFAQDSIFDPPYDSVRVALYITHDQLDWIDSIATIVVPFRFAITNPASGCSLPDHGYWNNTAMIPDNPMLSRSLFRNLVDTTTGDTVHNRMVDLATQYMGLEWARVQRWMVNRPANPDSNTFKLIMVPSAPTDRWWWEGEKVLLATLTFTTYDTTTVCIDSTFWSPSSPLSFWRGDGYKGYVPRHNLPYCFRITLSLPVCGSRPGDVNLDWSSDVSDLTYLINHLFLGGSAPAYCDCADVNCDAEVNLGDVTYYINYLFIGGAPLQACAECY